MNLAYKKILGKFTKKVLGFGKTPPHIGKNSQIISFFFFESVPNQGGVKTAGLQKKVPIPYFPFLCVSSAFPSARFAGGAFFPEKLKRNVAFYQSFFV